MEQQVHQTEDFCQCAAHRSKQFSVGPQYDLGKHQHHLSSFIHCRSSSEIQLEAEDDPSLCKAQPGDSASRQEQKQLNNSSIIFHHHTRGCESYTGQCVDSNRNSCFLQSFETVTMMMMTMTVAMSISDENNRRRGTLRPV